MPRDEARGIALEQGAPSAAGERTGSASAAADKRALRGTSFAEGEQRLAPQGSALVAGSTQAGEVAGDRAFTPMLVDILQKHPQQSLDAAIAQIAATPGGIGDYQQHATTSAIGDQAARGQAGKAAGGKKVAALVANSHYKDPNLKSLFAPKPAATALAGTLGGRGFETQIREDLTASQMRAAFATAALGSGVKAGDSVVLHYGGHGLKSGLCGVNLDGVNTALADERAASADVDAAIKPSSDKLKARDRDSAGLDPSDILPNSSVDGIARAAVAKGVHVTMMLDSCHSGAAADAVQEPQAATPTATSADAGGAASQADPAAIVRAAVEAVSSAKAGLNGLVADWAADAMTLDLGPSWDDAHMKDLQRQLAERYMAMIAKLWDELLVPRVMAAVASVQSLGTTNFGAAPAVASTAAPGVRPETACVAAFTWLDQAREGVKALAGARPPIVG